MKTRKHTLTRVAIGVALATVSLSTLAAPPIANPAGVGASAIIAAEKASVDPTFSRGEQAGLCLMESVVSLLAARTNDFACGTKTYDLEVLANADGISHADIAGGANNGGTTLHAALGSLRDIGTRCTVATAFGDNRISGVRLAYYGDHGWSRKNDIFNSNAHITMWDPQTGSPNLYKEVNIKDYFKRVISARSWEFDWGLEDIKKWRNNVRPANATQLNFNFDPGFYYPVQKWQELSWYQHENGQEGQLYVRKVLTNPRSSAGCQIRVEVPLGNVFNGGSTFEASGTVSVGRFSRLPF